MLDKIRSGVVSIFSNKKFLAILLVAVLFIAEGGKREKVVADCRDSNLITNGQAG